MRLGGWQSLNIVLRYTKSVRFEDSFHPCSSERAKAEPGRIETQGKNLSSRVRTRHSSSAIIRYSIASLCGVVPSLSSRYLDSAASLFPLLTPPPLV